MTTNIHEKADRPDFVFVMECFIFTFPFFVFDFFLVPSALESVVAAGVSGKSDELTFVIIFL